jgi:hypothetical protein
MPKLDENQEQYTTFVHNGFTVFAIPTTCQIADTVAPFLEAMCAESYRYVTPAYYDVALKVKYARDDYTSGMIDLIYNGIADMFCIVYGGAYANDIFTWAILGPLQRKEDSITSEYQKREKPAVKSLQRLVEAYQEMAVPELPAP